MRYLFDSIMRNCKREGARVVGALLLSRAQRKCMCHVIRVMSVGKSLELSREVEGILHGLIHRERGDISRVSHVPRSQPSRGDAAHATPTCETLFIIASSVLMVKREENIFYCYLFFASCLSPEDGRK